MECVASHSMASPCDVQRLQACLNREKDRRKCEEEIKAFQLACGRVQANRRISSDVQEAGGTACAGRLCQHRGRFFAPESYQVKIGSVLIRFMMH